ncbi:MULTISPECIES: hypothetical protein [unclassified Mycobacterium]|uniref:hypothetical protein n=1 Tax=unclassified Mycobacterium TaxID=2642494 RepID=UPI0029C8BF88|nr:MULTISPECIES: hypothetical protein [unclassified Mycobacterium]
MNRSLAPALALCFGMAMVAATFPQTHWLALWTAGLAVAAVLTGVQFRSAATIAVLLTALTLAISAPPPMLSAVSGLCATGYLVMRHTSGPISAGPTRATAAAAVAFSAVATAVAAVPLDVPWLPLLAPFGLLGVYALVIHPYLRQPKKS